MSENEKQWFLITAKANQDSRAEQNLTNQGYEIYRPLARVPRIRRGKRQYQIESLFPRYLFIRLNVKEDNWSPIRSTYGVSGFVRFGSLPSVVPDSLIRFLKENETVFEQKAVNIDDFQQNDAIKVLDGLFKGYEGIFIGYEGEHRATILLQFLGQQRPITLSPSALMPI